MAMQTNPNMYEITGDKYFHSKAAMLKHGVEYILAWSTYEMLSFGLVIWSLIGYQT